MSVELIDRYTRDFIGDGELENIACQTALAHRLVASGGGVGGEYTGWARLPIQYDRGEFDRIADTSRRIRANSKVFVVIGIGGSYLGARAAIEFVKSTFHNELPGDSPRVYFAGNNISGTALADLADICSGTDFSINVISKSGSTTEPALAFRVFKQLLEEKYSAEEARSRIFVTTDKERGPLLALANRMGYETFAVPDDVGGRYSVLTAVGLLPIAVAGVDIGQMMKGAEASMSACASEGLDNPGNRYAALRNILYRKGYTTEIFVGYEPRLAITAEWWKQLFGESEGKDNRGIYPSSAMFSTDLHSLGQYIQSGRRNLFETALWIGDPGRDVEIAATADDVDGLNFLSGRTVKYVNQKAYEATLLAHCDGGVPNITVRAADFSPFAFGELAYFFEHACAVSGYLLGVNPFDQPGVEDYKRNMFALLGKPGYEERRAVLEARINA